MWNNSFFIPASSTSSCFQIHSGRRTQQRIASRDASRWAPRSFQFKWISGVGPCGLTLFFRVEACAEGRASWRLQEDTQCCSTWQSRQNILQKSTLRHTSVRGWNLLCVSLPFFAEHNSGHILLCFPQILPSALWTPHSNFSILFPHTEPSEDPFKSLPLALSWQRNTYLNSCSFPPSFLLLLYSNCFSQYSWWFLL